jgi:ABC-type polysaccharide/polyol phosphate transport system ATPase subunit
MTCDDNILVTSLNGSTRIHLRGIGLDFTLYKNKSFAIREWLLNSFAFRDKRSEPFHALGSINLDVACGERIVFLGPNGAGKSSLLKVIAGIYPPSRGEMSIQGRITPLIEMGAGFHHELTGRENTFLNGAILGAAHGEIESRLNQILEFAEISHDFLDTPIKYYSTGMRTRLAFAIAMELEPQILILDEIFSNADAHFVQKATARMNDSKSAAHILLFVTHDLELARRVAKRCIWVSGGEIIRDGPIEQVMPEYEAAMNKNGKPFPAHNL